MSATRRHVYTRTVFVSVLASFVVGIISTMIVVFYIQIAVIVDVVDNPASPHYVNWFVVAYSILSLVFTSGLSLAKAPLPHVNKENWVKLSEIEKNDPDAYIKIMRRFANDDNKKERNLANIVFSATFAALYGCTSIWIYGAEYIGAPKFLAGGAFGIVVVLSICPAVVLEIKKRSARLFFQRNPEKTLERLLKFRRMLKIRMAVSYFALPVLFSALIIRFLID